MTQTTVLDPHVRAIASALPEWHWSTGELLTAAGGRLSDALADMMGKLGVDNRHSILANYPQVLFDGAEPEVGLPAGALAVRAVRRCLDKADVPAESIGLVIGATSSPGRLLPSMVCDLVADLPEIPRSADTLSVQYMGCSVIAKVVETARWYLSCNPGKYVLAAFLDAITPLSPPLPGRYAHFSEIEAERRQETVDAMHGFLFGDAAVAVLFESEGDGPSFGPGVSLTNELPEDTELGTVPDGGSDVPIVHGRRLYTLSPRVAARGLWYASRTIKEVIASGKTGLAAPADATALFMHTGSKQILDGLCAEFEVRPDSDKVASAYRVLRECGNTIGCSVPLMLAEQVHRPEGESLVMAFGLSFSAGALSMKVPPGGWTP
ncbi:3-oxoacyl-[acyl-carrier-protein] synthase III C-terminal domain-containing protein [Actinosynnema sp. NPDC047251]|uniref:Beta-ketoacyl synthase III n=1 Tax=Saccharothrix espanaensis (strain ATCC 51144 / DSM 44229 / JCM 9112 / NBRC 15066 / NRRL 15764) TaxID=1179773 RepID=K0JWY5_SACES|nr:3-oxoacyl-[acyl-carrier-protein] synthase III C-terminal domain-containing protein [Saccharothrix espanaensis]CCH32380.1 Beta-ketoacyl synthase III [Saccharothrix espanaensis DSM 44229]